MCGRAQLPDDVSEIKQDLQIEWEDLGDRRPRWNVPPTEKMPVVFSAGGKHQVEMMRWGLIPWWAKDIKELRSTFNARAETVSTTPAFRDAWKDGRRCLVVVNAYYEWRKSDRQPFAIALANRGPMTLAGLWDSWRNPDGEKIRSFTVITTTPNELTGRIHDRMPVILGPEDWAQWLGDVPATDAELKAMLKPFAPNRMTLWAIDRKIGNVRNDSPDLIDPVPEPSPA
jgi:putative SOS response-associated peptidase YedK